MAARARTRMRKSAQVWRERVERWKQSGKTSYPASNSTSGIASPSAAHAIRTPLLLPAPLPPHPALGQLACARSAQTSSDSFAGRGDLAPQKSSRRRGSDRNRAAVLLSRCGGLHTICAGSILPFDRTPAAVWAISVFLCEPTKVSVDLALQQVSQQNSRNEGHRERFVVSELLVNLALRPHG